MAEKLQLLEEQPAADSAEKKWSKLNFQSLLAACLHGAGHRLPHVHKWTRFENRYGKFGRSRLKSWSPKPPISGNFTTLTITIYRV